MKPNKIIITILLIAGLLLPAVNVCRAENADCSSKTKLCDPLNVGNGAGGAAKLIGRIIKELMRLIGILSLLFFVIGGFYYLSSAGNPEKVKKGTSTLVWSVLGIILASGAYYLVSFLLESFVTPT